MYSLYANDDDILYGVQKYILDTEEDVEILPTDVKAGSSALVVETTQFYVLNNRKEWVKMAKNENLDTFLEWGTF